MGKKTNLMDDVVEAIIRLNFISIPFLQRRFKVNYLTAQGILSQLENWKYIQKGKEFSERKVLKHKYIQ